MIKESIKDLVEGKDLSADTAYACMEEMMSGSASDVAMAAFLTALSIKRASIEEITAFAKCMRNHALEFDYSQDLLEIVGTGGDASNSLLGSNEAVYWFQSFLVQWKTLGWNSIIYMAAIAGIDQEQYEAARVDGAGHFKCAIHVTLPAMMETFVVLFILNIGNFLNTGYEQYLLFKNSLTATNIEVLDLYTYRIGLQNMDYSYGVAISVVKSIVSITLVLAANMVAKKIRGRAVI